MSADASGDAKERANLFLSLVAQNQPVWGLRNEAGGLATWKYDESEETLIPFWSDKAKAEACAVANFPDYSPFEMSVLPKRPTGMFARVSRLSKRTPYRSPSIAR